MKKKEVYKERMAALKQNATKKYTNERFLEKRKEEDHKVKIEVVLPQDFELFDPLAPTKYGMLNPEIYRYIEEQVYFVPSEYDIVIHFSGKKLLPNEQDLVRKALQDHYNLQVYDKLDDIRRNRLLGIFLLIFGSIALALYFFMTLRNHNFVLLEIISIVGTFSVWESVNCWLIQGHERRVDLHNALQMALVQVSFHNLTDKTE